MASHSGHFPQRYKHFTEWLRLKFFGVSYLDIGISLSCELETHQNVDQYYKIERNINFYGTIILDKDEHVDSKYFNSNLNSYELFTVQQWFKLKFNCTTNLTSDFYSNNDRLDLLKFRDHIYVLSVI